MSHPLRVRGLKPARWLARFLRRLSHPLRVRGLKRLHLSIRHRFMTSHPLRVRGLKPDRAVVHPIWIWSHPLRERDPECCPQCNGLSFLFRAYDRHLSRFPANTEQEAASRKAASCSRAQNQNDKAAPAPYVASLPDLPTLALKVRLSVARRLAPIASAFSPSKLPIPTPMANHLL